jgi:hypothetical protein
MSKVSADDEERRQTKACGTTPFFFAVIYILFAEKNSFEFLGRNNFFIYVFGRLMLRRNEDYTG